MRVYRLVALCLGVCLLTSFAWSHDPGLSTATIRLGLDEIQAELGFSIVDAAEIIDIDLNRDGINSPEELLQATREAKQLAASALEIHLDTNIVAASSVRAEFDTNNNLNVSLAFPCHDFHELIIRSKWLARLQPGHRQFVSVQTMDGQTLAERMLNANLDYIKIQMDLPDTPTRPAASPKAAESPFLEFLELGVRHIGTGYDHLLFLLGLLIVTPSFRSAIGIISCFTLAHAVTLGVATLGFIAISSRAVEPLIALTIVYVGVENLVMRGKPKARWLLTFCFGLIHGFGFAAVLRERGVGLGAGGKGITVPLVGFNLGVEFGQIAIALIILPLAWQISRREKWRTAFVQVSSGIIIILGAYWLLKRVL